MQKKEQEEELLTGTAPLLSFGPGDGTALDGSTSKSQTGVAMTTLTAPRKEKGDNRFSENFFPPTNYCKAKCCLVQCRKDSEERSGRRTWLSF